MTTGKGQTAQDRAARRLAEEAVRIEAVRDGGRVPEAASGGAIRDAPARGPVALHVEMELVPQADGSYRQQLRNHQGRTGLRVADAFDKMRAKAAPRGAAAAADLFTPGQVAMGRRYRALVERHDAGGMKCSSLDGRVSGGGAASLDMMDRMLMDRRELDILLRRIGPGVALSVRRVRPSKRGARLTIPVRDLVDRVCLRDQTVSDVLRAYGWSVKGQTVDQVRAALRDALDRMQGPAARPGVRTLHLGGGVR